MSILPLETWRKIIGYAPWSFWGFADNEIVPLTSACNDVVQKYAWQDTDAAGRYDILQAIEQAEARLTGYMRYAPAPHYIVEEHPFPRFPDERFDRLGYVDASGRWPSVQMNEGHIQKVGVLTRTLLDTDAVVYSDPDGDGLDELATITTAVTFTDTTQVAVYVPAADRLNSDDVSEDYRIQPVKVSITGGVATIRINAWLMAKPILYEGVDRVVIDPTDSANFLSTVEVYRLYIDPTGITADTAQAKLTWETRPHPYWCVCGCNTNIFTPSNSLDPAAEGYAMARVALRQPELGIVALGQATYNSTTDQFVQTVNWQSCRPPDKVTIRAWAGKPLVNGEMDVRMQRVVAYFATAELARPICACQDANRQIYHWQFDLARTGGADGEQYGAISADDLNCPYGTRRGHVYAWKETRDMRLITGYSVV